MSVILYGMADFYAQNYKERDAIDPTQNRPCLPPQRKSQSRAEAALLSAPGENS